MPGSWIMHPQTAITMSGFCFRTSFSQVTLPSARRSAFSRTQQVLKITKSASSRFTEGTMPISSSMPAIFSESWAFIWQP